jgi:hypothetical protein
MNESAQTSLRGEDSAMGGVLHLAIEMGEKKWDLLFGGGEPKENGRVGTYRKTIAGREGVGLQEAVQRAREKLKWGADVPVVSCYEAGQDGFWPHRKLEELGIANRVVDSASIEVKRRFRRAKDDGLDVHKLLEMLMRAQGGERGVWREVRVASVEEEDQRRLHRELERLNKEEKQPMRGSVVNPRVVLCFRYKAFAPKVGGHLGAVFPESPNTATAGLIHALSTARRPSNTEGAVNKWCRSPARKLAPRARRTVPFQEPGQFSSLEPAGPCPGQ